MGYIGKITDTAGSTHLVGSTLYGTCSTAAGTAAKVVTCSNFGELVTGVTIHVKFDNANLNTELGATLNVNNTGAKTIVGGIGGSTVPGQGFRWAAGCVVSFTYDGTYWVMNDSYLNTSTDTKVLQTATTTNSNYPILFKNSANQTDETDQVRYGNTSGKIPKINPSTGDINANSFNGLGIMAESAGGATTGFILSLGLSSIEVGADGITISANSGETQLEVPDGSTYSLGDACEADLDTSINSGSPSTTNVPTSYAVTQYVAGAVSGANAFQGTLVANGTPSSGTWDQADIEASSYSKGWYWVCSTAGTYCGNVLEAGDMLFCVESKGSGSYSASHFNAVQNNIETLTTTEVSNLWTAAVAVS